MKVFWFCSNSCLPHVSCGHVTVCMFSHEMCNKKYLAEKCMIGGTISLTTPKLKLMEVCYVSEKQRERVIALVSTSSACSTI